MSFSLPTDLATDFVDDESEVDAAYFNGVSGMGNALKAAVATLGFNLATADVTASETTTSATYANLTTTTDQVTVPIGSSGKALVFFQAKMSNSGANYNYVSFELSGANTVSATDAYCIQHASSAANVARQSGTPLLLTDLTPGFTTFKMKYRTNTGTATFSNRRITVIPLPATDGTHASATLPLDLSSSLSLGLAAETFNRPVYDSVGAGSAGLGTSRSYTHTVSADAKAVVLYMNTSSGSYSTTVAPTPTVTFGGQAMTLLGRVYAFTDNSTWTWLCAYGLLNPPTGAQTVSATLANSYTAMNTVAYTDVAGWGAVTIKTGNSTNPTITSPSGLPNRVVSGALATYTQQMSSVTTNQRSIQNYSNGVSYGLAIGDGDQPYRNTIACTATTGAWAGLTVDVIRNVTTFSKPTWVGTGLGEVLAHHKTNPGTSWIETVPADANLALLWVSEMPSDQANNCTVTLGGTSMVEVTGSPWTFEIGSGTYQRTRCFALQNPTTGGNQTVSITDNVSNYFHAHTVYYGGVTAIGPAGAYARGAGSTTPTLAIPDTVSNHLYAMCFGYRGQDANSTFTAFSAGSTMRAVHNNDSGGYSVPMGVGDAYGNDGTLTVTATRYNSTYGWNAIAIDLRPDALPTPTNPTWVGTGAGRQHFSGNYSWTETVPTNATCAIVTLSALGATACSVTLGGTSMTALTGSPFTLYSGNYSTQTFFLLNPASGSKTLSVTNANGNNVHAIVTFYGGVAGVFNQTAITTGAGGQQPSISMSNTLATHRYLTAFGFRTGGAGDAITAVDQGTLRMSHPNYSYDLALSVSDAAGNGGTLTVNGTRSNTTYEWGGMIVDLSPDTRPSAALNLSLTPSISMSGTGHNGS